MREKRKVPQRIGILISELLLDVVAELQEENGKLNDALQVGKEIGNVFRSAGLFIILFFTKPQEVEEALEKEAKKLRLADGGVLLESLRTRRLLETAELALKVRRVPS